MAGRPDFLRIALWGGGTLLVLLLFLVGALVYRRHYRAANQAPGRSVWTLDDLSAMRHRGELSEAEYARLRDRVLAQMGIHRSRGDDASPR